jgi:hypothetical protein
VRESRRSIAMASLFLLVMLIGWAIMITVTSVLCLPATVENVFFAQAAVKGTSSFSWSH